MAEESNIVEKKEPSTLSSSLNTEMKPFPIKMSTKGGQDYVKQQSALSQKEATSRGELEKAKTELQTNLMGAEAESSKQYAQDVRGLQQEAENKELEYPRPEFHPTRENAETLGGLFSMVATFGIILGNSGKLASQNALGAMTGMLKGWQEGRKDLYERELKEFDKEYKRINDIRTDIQNHLQKAMQLAAVDKDASLKERQYAVSLAGQSSILGYQMQNMQDQAALQTLQSGMNINLQYEKMQQQAKQHAESMKLQQDRLQLEKQKLTQGGVTGALPKESKIREQYSSRYQTIKNIEDIQSLLQDPKYAKFINPTTKFTPDVLLNLQKNFPELQSKLARIQAIEFETGGKSLTANESKILEPIYGWRGITADALKQRLDGIKKNLENNQGMQEIMYPGFTQLKPQFDKYYEQSGKVPVVPNDVGGGQQIPTVKTKAEYDALPSGTEYYEDDGKKYRKP